LTSEELGKVLVFETFLKEDVNYGSIEVILVLFRG
jgi:hypothetical protein